MQEGRRQGKNGGEHLCCARDVHDDLDVHGVNRENEAAGRGSRGREQLEENE